MLRIPLPEYDGFTLAKHVNFNTTNTKRCVALFVTLGYAHEKPTHLAKQEIPRGITTVKHADHPPLSLQLLQKS